MGASWQGGSHGEGEECDEEGARGVGYSASKDKLYTTMYGLFMDISSFWGAAEVISGQC